MFDFSELRSIDSTGLAALLEIDRKLAARGKYAVIATGPGQVLRTLSTAGLRDSFPVAPTVEAALELLPR